MADQTTRTSSERSFKPIVTVDKNQPHFFDFDKAVDVSEIPVNKKFSIELTIGENAVIPAETSVLQTKKMRVVFTKNENIFVGNSVQLSLVAIYEKLSNDYFLNIPCLLSKIEHFDHVTHAEITISDQANTEFTSWYQQWLSKFKNVKSREGINKDAFNFIYQYYKRLYCDHLAYPILFSDDQQIKQAYITKVGSVAISFASENETDVRLPINVIQPYITLPSKINRIPLYVWYEEGQIHYFSKADYPSISPKKVISWLMKKPQWRVLLVRNRKIVFADEQQRNEIVQYFTDDISPNDSSFEDDFFKLCISTNILDISCLFQQIDLPECSEELQEKQMALPELDVDYQTISFRIKRIEARYNYLTKVKITALDGNEVFDAETIDISMQGLSINSLTTSCLIKEHDSVSIAFTQWNDEIPKKLLQKKEEIESVEYKVTSICRKHDYIKLGLKLDNNTHISNFNRLIKSKIKEIKKTTQGSIRNSSDAFQSLVSSLWINNNIAGLVFFIGRDGKGIHILQAVANTEGNKKLRQPFQENNDWTFLQQHAFSLSNAVKEVNNIGVYCYFDDHQWQSKTDLDFTSAQNKRDFINTAVMFKKHYFYHCTLNPIIPGKDDILNGESSSLVSLGQHRLKEIHQICRSLVVIGELNDVTRLIEFMYKVD